VNRATQRPWRGELRRMSASQGGQSDGRIVGQHGPGSNDAEAIQSQRLTVQQATGGPEKADLGRLALGCATSPPCGPVWARVGRTGMVAS
jgi:hypothetical protein